MSRTVLQIVPAAAALLFAVVAAVWDARTRRIPNRMVLLATASACIIQLAASGWRGLGSSAIAAAVALLLMSIGFFSGGIGAGDVKLMGAMGLFAGLSSLSLLLTTTALAGGVFALSALGYKKYVKVSLHRPTSDAAIRSLTVPYALPIACGVFAVFCHALRSIR